MQINNDAYYFLWIENPCVGGSIPPQATKIQSQLFAVGFVVFGGSVHPGQACCGGKICCSGVGLPEMTETLHVQ
jgi:hypothetical protein